MRVLFIDPHPTAHSETYISGEAAWMQRHGVEIGFWAKGERAAPGVGNPLFGELSQVVRAFHPDVLHLYAHVHPSTVTAIVDVVSPLGVPLTIRGHSLGFNVGLYRGLRAVARIWLFPHHAELVKQENVVALPVSYDPALYFPEDPSEERYVVRAGAAQAGKDMEGFLRVAARCPDVKFALIATGGNTVYLNTLEQAAPPNVRLHFHLESAVAAEIVRRGWVCLRGHDVNAHAYGMPISIAEALGAGLPIIARAADPDSPARFGPESYAGAAGRFYKTDEEAAAHVREVVNWSRKRWNRARSRSLKQARQYSADVVLPRMLAGWLALT